LVVLPRGVFCKINKKFSDTDEIAVGTTVLIAGSTWIQMDQFTQKLRYICAIVGEGDIVDVDRTMFTAAPRSVTQLRKKSQDYYSKLHVDHFKDLVGADEAASSEVVEGEGIERVDGTVLEEVIDSIN